LSKPNKRKLLLLLALLIVGTLATFVPRSQAHALTYPKPSWWTYSDSSHQHCDSGHFGNTYTLLTTWNGLEVCGPVGTNTSVTFPNGVGEGEWQCVELVARYLLIVYGAPALSNTNGDQVVANYASTYSSLFTSITNDGNTHAFPKVGDVLSYSTVHTAIITGITVTDQTNGNATLNLIEQNASSNGTTTQKVIGWKIKGGVDDPNDTGSDTVSAWLTPKESWSTVSPGGTTYDKIYSMAAASTTSVWAAGNEGANPVTYYDNGAGWTKYSPTAQCSCNHYLYGIATIPASGDTWTVGAYTPSNIKTLAYHWNGTSWVHVTSDNPASNGYSNYLYGAAIDSSGGVWAAGSYWLTGSGYQPLIEKWNSGTSNFDKQTVPLPSGQVASELNGVAFSSSSNGWAVGDANASGGSDHWVIYHYDGTSWSSNALGSTNYATLKSVAVVSDSEAWAVGYQGSPSKPLILHYTSANGWVEDTSFNSYYPSGTYLNSVGTDASNDVWIAGQYGGGPWYPYTMHYNGYYWVQSNTPTVSSNSYLEGVAVSSGDAWAGGYIGDSNPTPLVFQYS